MRWSDKTNKVIPTSILSYCRSLDRVSKLKQGSVNKAGLKYGPPIKWITEDYEAVSDICITMIRWYMKVLDKKGKYLDMASNLKLRVLALDINAVTSLLYDARNI